VIPHIPHTDLILGDQKALNHIVQGFWLDSGRWFTSKFEIKKLLGFLFICLLHLPVGAQNKAIQITDDRGVVVRFTQSPQRIVSILPSLSESVCELGRCQRLVGVDRYSNWPLALTRLPQVGGGLDPNIEAIVALKPDVVLMAVSSRAFDRLEGLGIKVLAIEPKTHADVQRILKKLGHLLDVPEEQGAARLWRNIEAGIATAVQMLPKRALGITPSSKPTTVYFEVNPAPYAAGESSFMGETLTRLGAKNIIPAALGPFPKINPEFVVRANPDVIMVGLRGSAGLEQRPGWQGLRALREKRLCIFSDDESDVLVRPGPRMAEAALLMATCLKTKAP
jgi:iron complex transport system substrate-binding protein